MTTATLDREIKSYLPLLGYDEKQSVLTVIKSFLNLKSDNGTVDIKQYNREIDMAMARIDNGEFTTHEDVEKEMESW